MRLNGVSPAPTGEIVETTLVPMQESAFAAYRESAIRGYAEENIAAGRWSEEAALDLAREDFESLLPQGLATPDSYLYQIHAISSETKSSTHVGYLWFAVVTKTGVRTGYVYDLEVLTEFRLLGHAERAFSALESVARELGLTSIGLHVFAHNPGARALYAKLGYKVTGHTMVKHFA